MWVWWSRMKDFRTASKHLSNSKWPQDVRHPSALVVISLTYLSSIRQQAFEAFTKQSRSASLRALQVWLVGTYFIQRSCPLRSLGNLLKSDLLFFSQLDISQFLGHGFHDGTIADRSLKNLFTVRFKDIPM